MIRIIIRRISWQRPWGSKIRVQEKTNHQKHKTKVRISSMNHTEKIKHKYESVKNRLKRSVSKPQHVEALLVADWTAIEFHEDGDVETYLLTIMNMVSIINLFYLINMLIQNN